MFNNLYSKVLYNFIYIIEALNQKLKVLYLILI